MPTQPSKSTGASKSRRTTPPRKSPAKRTAASNGDLGAKTGRASTAHDPAYSLPLLGPLIAQADRFRTQLPIGSTWNKSEAEVLRAEARALHAVANYLELRAKQLEKLERERDGVKPRVQRVTVE